MLDLYSERRPHSGPLRPEARRSVSEAELLIRSYESDFVVSWDLISVEVQRRNITPRVRTVCLGAAPNPKESGADARCTRIAWCRCFAAPDL